MPEIDMMPLTRVTILDTIISGGMAEWMKAAVLKTVAVRAAEGSNPSPTAAA
jgi:hypothetical protein